MINVGKGLSARIARERCFLTMTLFLNILCSFCWLFRLYMQFSHLGFG